MKYLESFNITEVNEEMLEWIVPIMKNCLTKVNNF